MGLCVASAATAWTAHAICRTNQHWPNTLRTHYPHQFFCGYSGQTLIDGIPAAVYNVIFTSMPILLFSILDRPVKYLTTLMRYPQVRGGRTGGFSCVGV